MKFFVGQRLVDGSGNVFTIDARRLDEREYLLIARDCIWSQWVDQITVERICREVDPREEIHDLLDYDS
jgi:hypothetical protein